MATEITREQVIMGTISSISLQNKDKKEIKKAFNILKDVENSLSSYKKDAKVYRLNHDKSVVMDSYLYEILQNSYEMHESSDGYFDITIGSITKNLYRFGEDERVPNESEFRDVVVDFSSILIENDIVSLQKGVVLDFGGIAKGYGVDKVSNYLQERNITKARVSLSGDIRCINLCKFKIQSPFFENKAIFSFKSIIPNLSISTSGSYRRFVKNRKHHHLINPKTKSQADDFVSVTIFKQKDNTKADAIATAAFVMPKQKAIDFLLKQDVGFILIQKDKTTISSNLAAFVKLHIK
jgi:thiamine biosynthesis lipoprotein